MTFSGKHAVSFSQGRRNEVYVYQGYGEPGLVYSPSLGDWRSVGLPPPESAPTIQVDSSPSFYVSRIDIEEVGSGYNKPPKVTISDEQGAKTAKATASIRDGAINSITVTERGRGYTKPPCVTLTDPPDGKGEGAKVGFEISGTLAEGDPKTGIVYWEIEKRETPGTGQAPCQSDVEKLFDVVGSFNAFYFAASGQGGGGAGAKVRLNLLGTTWRRRGDNWPVNAPGCSAAPDLPSVEVEAFGSGYQPTDVVTAEVRFGVANYDGMASCQAGTTQPCTLVVRGYPIGHPKVPSYSSLGALNPSRSVKIEKATATSAGSQYFRGGDVVVKSPTDPENTWAVLRSESNCKGEITKIVDKNKSLVGTNCLFPPLEVPTVENTAAKAVAVIRPMLRGKYQCYYRFVNDSIPEDEGGPLYSSLSPVREVDCGDGAKALSWGVGGGGRGTSVELWRTTSGQATTLFRVAKLGGTGAFGSSRDDLSDWDLANPDREGFEAMPILLPNGELNANRFGVPPTNFAVGVMFQDRMWMGVDTSGKEPNTLRFSEADEPEAMPETNELILQSNLRSTDYVTALIPYAGALVVCQARHAHRLTYVAQPLIDASMFLLAYRGCVNQRCWDIYDGRVYAMDDQGVYSLDPQGSVESLTLGLDNLWQGKIDFAKREWFIVRADRRLNVLRVSVAFKGDAGKFPTRQLVYSFEYKSWWEERFPCELTAATECRTTDGQIALVYGTSNAAMYQLGVGLVDHAVDSVGSVKIESPGFGYRTPPAVRAVGGHGAEFESAINSDGEVTGIVVKQPGTRYRGGALVIEPPPEGGEQAAATYSIVNGIAPVHWYYRSGAFEFVNSPNSPGEGAGESRQVSVTYTPTKEPCELRLQAYYNNAKYPRSNVVRRDRGTGFVHSDEIPAACLNMEATPLEAAEAHGVARALFSGRVMADMMGSDRHISIGLAGRQDRAGPVSIHVLDIHGVHGGG